ncbi:oligopeptide/dipeptide ABC transporter ATP-binding protein [Kibdelosporangium banguiense]|uniref:Oligopeptide/dipeptide ABC transporter ATP-binding protein n=1 Tax=Kibdelosporangium banguiense TaxID=1365924 RepID=A0ABS4TXV8_9PSEU|nr:dipeptide/oligopeptide/nickel ABC transporter permease/ATP-binding protein [Kibdelosporangium banguiense]MBP2329236.1 oligopeptide/dipeptide ABC transporter ATP-binding protein [Kibdelosporangium banguiense]
MAPQKQRHWLRAALRTPGGAAGAGLVAALVLTAIFAPVLLGGTAVDFRPAQANLGASWQHLFGTDELGRDILARTLVAVRLSLLTAAGAVIIATAGGVLLGALAAVLGKVARQVLYQVTSAATAFPPVLVGVLVAVMLGRSSWAAMIGLAVAGIPGIARVTLNLSTSVAGSEFVTAAKVIGVPRGRILLRYILPSVAGPLLTSLVLSIGSAMLFLSAISFLGLGTQAPGFDLGSLMTSGLANVYTLPMAAVGPGLVIVLVGVAFNLLGEALGTGIDPRQRAAISSQGRVPKGDKQSATTRTAPRPANQDAVLAIEDLRVTIDKAGDTVELVRGVDVSVGRGEMLGIVGESGSGKTMTLSAMSRLLPPSVTYSADRHEFAGEDLHLADEARLRRVISNRMPMIFQDPMSSLNPALRIGTQLGQKVLAHNRTSRAEARSRVVRVLESVLIPLPAKRARQYPHELSGGMRQRVMIAMALLGEAEVILADEPTTALDVSVQKQVMDLLTAINREKGAAVVLVSHDLALVAQVTTRIVVMYAGRIVEEGTTADIVGKPLHPYTQMLLGAVPDLSRGTDEPLTAIPGVPPKPEELTGGCSFAPRCPLATDRCRAEEPSLQRGPDGRAAACWLVNDAVPAPSAARSAV